MSKTGVVRSLLLLALGFALAVRSHPEPLERDVCIIGGGSSGTYAAIRLQQMGVTVALIEKEDRLGGKQTTF